MNFYEEPSSRKVNSEMILKISAESLWVLCCLGLAVLLGPTLQFVPSVTWQDGPVANAMVWHDRQRIEQVFLLALVAIGAASVWRDRLIQILSLLPQKILSILVLGFSLGALSAGMSDYVRYAWLEWTTFLLLLSLAWLLAGEARYAQARFDLWAVRLVILVMTVVAIRILMGYLAAMLEGMRVDSVKLFTSVVSNRRVFGQVASMAIPLLAYPLLSNADWKPWQRVMLLGLLSVWWMLAIASGTRGTWMAIGVASVVLLMVAWRHAWPWVRIQLVALMFGLILYGLLFVLLPDRFYPDALVENRLGNLTDLAGRGAIWSMSLMQIQTHPWLGIGPMHMAAVLGHVASHPHNLLLQLCAEWGIPAALALLIPMLWGVARLLLWLRRGSDPLLVSVTAALLAAGAQAMVDGVFVMPYTQLWLILVAGWAIGIHMRKVDALRGRPVMAMTIKPWLISLVMVASLALMLWGVFPEILHRVEYTKAYLDAGHDAIPPRFWMVGPIP
jgi:O-antigen ligase